jgi:hypothetical protein
MSTNLETKDIEQLLAEADELIRNVKSDAIKDIQEDHRLRCEIHARNLEILKSQVQGSLAKKEATTGSGAEGMHAAIQEIVKAMGDLKKYLSFTSDGTNALHKGNEPHETVH